LTSSLPATERALFHDRVTRRSGIETPISKRESRGIVQLTGSCMFLEKHSENVRDAIERVAFNLWKRL